MEVIVIDSMAFEKLKQELFEFISQKMEEREHLLGIMNREYDWVDVKTAMQLLNVKRTKLQQLKNDGMIHFSQIKKKLLFSRKSIEAYLRKHSTF